MANVTRTAMDLWMWPLQAARLGSDWMETLAATQRVITARLPTIASAMQNPFTADHGELNLMVTEKVGALRSSGRAVDEAGAVLRRAADANARAFGRMAGGGVLWPADWMRLAEGNLAAAAALAALPAATLAPVHKRVTANDRRLGSRQGGARAAARVA